MDLLEAIDARHAVRSYKDVPIEDEKVDLLKAFIAQCNRESGLNMELFCNEPNAYSAEKPHYGQFTNVRNYIAVKGRKMPNMYEKCGYYGEKVVLYAQQIGLNTCWVALSYHKSKAKDYTSRGDKLCLTIPIGYGTTSGVMHKSKSAAEVIKNTENPPEWFIKGVEAALKAPTAMNQQKFTFSLSENKVSAKSGAGFYTSTDLGIVKYHFEIGAGLDNFEWA